MPDRAIKLDDPPELGPEFFRQAQLRLPQAKQAVSLRLDAEVLAWFRQQGPGYQTRMNAVLRAYMEAQSR